MGGKGYMKRARMGSAKREVVLQTIVSSNAAENIGFRVTIEARLDSQTHTTQSNPLERRGGFSNLRFHP